MKVPVPPGHNPSVVRFKATKVRVRVRVGVSVGVSVSVSVSVSVRVRVISTHTCVQGRVDRHGFSEGGQRPGRERASRKSSSAHTTCHNTQAAQFDIHHPSACGFPYPTL